MRARAFVRDAAKIAIWGRAGAWARPPAEPERRRTYVPRGRPRTSNEGNVERWLYPREDIRAHAARSAAHTGNSRYRPARSAPTAASRSFRTACADTAATTPAKR